MATTEITTTQERPLAAMLNNPQVIRRFEQAVGAHAGSFIVNILNAANNSPDLWKCEPQTVITAGLNAAAANLSLSPSLGQACILAYKKNYKDEKGVWQTTYRAQFQPMARGVKALALRTNKYRYLNSFYVFEGEVPEEDRITGLFKISGERVSDKITHYGAAFELFNGYRHMIIWPAEKCRKHGEEYSPTFDKDKKKFHDKSRWVTHFDEQCTKTVMRHLILHYGEISERDRAILAASEENNDGAELLVSDNNAGLLPASSTDNRMIETSAGVELGTLSKEDLAKVAANENELKVVRDAATNLLKSAATVRTHAQNMSDLGFVDAVTTKEDTAYRYNAAPIVNAIAEKWDEPPAKVKITLEAMHKDGNLPETMTVDEAILVRRPEQAPLI